MAFQFFHSCSAQEATLRNLSTTAPAWALSEDKMSVPKVPCLVLRMPGQHSQALTVGRTPLTLLCITACHQACSQAAYTSVSQLPLWKQLFHHLSAASCARGFRQYGIKCHALFPSLVSQHQAPSHATPPTPGSAKNLIDVDFWRPSLPGCSPAQTTLSPNSSLGHRTALHVNSCTFPTCLFSKWLKGGNAISFWFCCLCHWHPIVIKKVGSAVRLPGLQILFCDLGLETYLP